MTPWQNAITNIITPPSVVANADQYVSVTNQKRAAETEKRCALAMRRMTPGKGYKVADLADLVGISNTAAQLVAKRLFEQKKLGREKRGFAMVYTKPVQVQKGKAHDKPN